MQATVESINPERKERDGNISIGLFPVSSDSGHPVLMFVKVSASFIHSIRPHRWQYVFNTNGEIVPYTYVKGKRMFLRDLVAGGSPSRRARGDPLDYTLECFEIDRHSLVCPDMSYLVKDERFVNEMEEKRMFRIVPKGFAVKEVKGVTGQHVGYELQKATSTDSLETETVAVAHAMTCGGLQKAWEFVINVARGKPSSVTEDDVVDVAQYRIFKETKGTEAEMHTKPVTHWKDGVDTIKRRRECGSDDAVLCLVQKKPIREMTRRKIEKICDKEGISVTFIATGK